MFERPKTNFLKNLLGSCLQQHKQISCIFCRPIFESRITKKGFTEASKTMEWNFRKADGRKI